MNWSRVERWVWYAFLVSAPWQTRVIVWQQGAAFSEWLSAAVWLSDVCIIGLIALALVRGWRIPKPDRVDAALIAFVGAGALSLAFAVDRTVSLIALARLAEFALFFLYVRHWAVRTFAPDASVTAFTVGALAQAGLAIAQSVLGHDVGLRFAGETLLRTDMHGVAVFIGAGGVKVLRAYGTLPHPNVLAAWLFAALAGLVWLYLRHGLPAQAGTRDMKERIIWGAAGTILLWGMLLTYSRTVITVAVAAAVIVVATHRTRLRSAAILGLAVCAVFAAAHWSDIVARGTIHGSDEAVQLRIDYARDALATGAGWHINWTGVGIGGFVPWLMRWAPGQADYLYQPAHSLPLLVYAETGVIGVAAFVALMVAIALRARLPAQAGRSSLVVLAAALVCISLTDHFFWTLQQGRILWWLVLALAVG